MQITIIYGRWKWMDEDDIAAFTVRNQINDVEFIPYGEAEIEVEIPSKQEQDRIEIDNLRNEITRTKADSQNKVETLEEKIQRLMALE